MTSPVFVGILSLSRAWKVAREAMQESFPKDALSMVVACTFVFPILYAEPVAICSSLELSAPDRAMEVAIAIVIWAETEALRGSFYLG